MVKRTLELFECDKCGKDGQRYSVSFPEDGTLILDRCEQHAKPLEKLRDEPGEWMQARPGKQSFHKSSLQDIRLAIQNGGGS